MLLHQLQQQFVHTHKVFRKESLKTKPLMEEYKRFQKCNINNIYQRRKRKEKRIKMLSVLRTSTVKFPCNINALRKHNK